MAIYVQYGSGTTAPEEWLNFYASPTLRFERLPLLGRMYTRNAARFPKNVRFGDIVRGLPVRAESCDGIYCSHVLEHLALDDCRRALRNTYAYLRPGGTFRLVVPDLEWLARGYLADRSPESASKFMNGSGLGYVQRPRGPGALLRALLGNSQHLWMWDEPSMSAELASAGFTMIRRCHFGDATDPMFQRVEDPERFVGALGLEARK